MSDPGNPAANVDRAADGAAAYDVFVSYASADRAAAEALRDALVREGLRPWTAFTDIPGGARYAAEIVEAIGQCRTLLVLVSAASVRSEHVFREVAEAAGRQRRILPVYLEAQVALPPQIRYYLRGLHRLKVDPADIAAAVPRIAAGIRHRDRWQAEADAPGLVERLGGSPRRAWAAMFGIVFAAGLAVWALQALWGGRERQAEQARQDMLPESLAMVQLGTATRDVGPAGSTGWQLRADLVLVAADARFADVQLHLASGGADAAAPEVFDLGDALRRDQVGGGQMLSVALPRLGERLTACLTLPHPRSGQRWRVTEAFAAAGDDRTRSYTRSAPARAAPDDGSRCGG